MCEKYFDSRTSSTTSKAKCTQKAQKWENYFILKMVSLTRLHEVCIPNIDCALFITIFFCSNKTHSIIHVDSLHFKRDIKDRKRSGILDFWQIFDKKLVFEIYIQKIEKKIFSEFRDRIELFFAPIR